MQGEHKKVEKKKQVKKCWNHQLSLTWLTAQSAMTIQECTEIWIFTMNTNVLVACLWKFIQVVFFKKKRVDWSCLHFHEDLSSSRFQHFVLSYECKYYNFHLGRSSRIEDIAELKCLQWTPTSVNSLLQNKWLHGWQVTFSCMILYLKQSFFFYFLTLFQ